jgi:hypothetical protein
MSPRDVRPYDDNATPKHDAGAEMRGHDAHEHVFGSMTTHCPYKTPELAREQYDRLVREAVQRFAPEAQSSHCSGKLRKQVSW